MLTPVSTSALVDSIGVKEATRVSQSSGPQSFTSVSSLPRLASGHQRSCYCFWPVVPDKTNRPSDAIVTNLESVLALHCVHLTADTQVIGDASDIVVRAVVCVDGH